MSDSDNHQPYVEDADSDGEPIEDTKTYISTALPEEANVSRIRKETRDRPRRRTSSRSPTKNHHTDSESTAHPRSPLKRGESKKHKDTDPKAKARKAEKTKPFTHRPGPPVRSVKTLPNIQTAVPPKRQQDPSFFGLSPPAPSPIIATSASMSRPRAYTANQRPNSYYGPSASRLPPANPRFWPNPPVGTSYPPQSPFHPPTAPPYLGPYPPPQAFTPPQPQADYFGQSPRVVQRTEYRRPTSAMGRQFPSPIIGYSPDYDDDQEDGGPVMRRGPSLKKRPTQQEEDRARMPPPRRPSTSVPVHSPFAPPSTSKRRSISSVTSLYDDESIDDESMYSASEQTRYDYRPHAVQRPTIEPRAMYDADPRHEQIERRARRNSHYGARPHSTEREFEDKMQTAQRYQAGVDGPTDPLTLDSIRRMNKTPSAGTKSSREHSGYAPTNRTGGADSEDMTILVKGTAHLTIGNTQMAVRDGAEIRIPTGAAGGGERNSRSGGGSDKSSTYEERERPPAIEEREREREREGRHRAARDRDRGARGSGRATSRAGSHSRGGGGMQYAPPQTEHGGGGGVFAPHPHQHHQHYQQVPAYGSFAPPGSYPPPYSTHF